MKAKGALIVGLLALVLAVSGAAHAEQASVSVEGIWLNVTGVDTFVGAAGDYEESWYQVWYWDGEYYEEMLYLYGGEQVILSPKPQGTVSGLSLKYELFLPSARGDWLRPGLRLTYWGTGGEASAEGSGPGWDEALDDWGEEDLDEDGKDDYWETYYGTGYGVSMWDESFYSWAYYDFEEFDLVQDSEENWHETYYGYQWEYDPDEVETSWYASSGFTNSAFECLLEFPVVETDQVYFSLLGGGKYATWNHHEEMGVTGEFADYDEEVYFQYPFEGIPYYDYYDEHYYDAWDLDSTAQVSLTGIGPCVGAFGRVRVSDWLSFTAKTTYAYVLGSATMEGMFTDYDYWEKYDYHEWGHWDELEGEWVYEDYAEDYASGSMSGEVPLSAQLAMSMGILEYQLALEADFGSFFAAAGYFGSTWLGVPLAPAFSYPLVEWDLSRRTMVNFGGPAIKVGIRF